MSRNAFCGRQTTVVIEASTEESSIARVSTTVSTSRPLSHGNARILKSEVFYSDGKNPSRPVLLTTDNSRTKKSRSSSQKLNSKFLSPSPLVPAKQLSKTPLHLLSHPQILPYPSRNPSRLPLLADYLYSPLQPLIPQHPHPQCLVHFEFRPSLSP